MAALIPKVNATTGSATAPGAGALATGELAENKFTGRLYVKTEAGTVLDPARVTLSGDVTGSTATATTETQAGTIAATVAKIQGRTVASTTPTAGQSLAWNNTTSQWEPTTVGGSSSIPGWVSFARARFRRYTASATYTAPAGLSGFLVVGIGAGGTITPVYNAQTTIYQAHGAQGGCAYSEKYYPTPTAGTNYSIVIGASGGTTSFAGTGMVLTSSSNINSLSGGTGGTATGGDFNANGGTGGASINTAILNGCSYDFTGNAGGAGASGSRYGAGGNGVSATGSAIPIIVYAAGGLGGVNGSGTTQPTISSTTLASGVSSLISAFDDTNNYPANNSSAYGLNTLGFPGLGAYMYKTPYLNLYTWPELPSLGLFTINIASGAISPISPPYRGNAFTSAISFTQPTNSGTIFIIEFYS